MLLEICQVEVAVTVIRLTKYSVFAVLVPLLELMLLYEMDQLEDNIVMKPLN